LLSFIIPAHDEEASIVASIVAIQDAVSHVPETYEIVVVDDASSDRTAELAARAGARVISSSRRHIAAARNAGAAAARGDIFLFVDADTIINAVVLAAALRALHEGAVGGGAGVRFDEPAPAWLRMLLPLFLWSLRRARLAMGCFLFCRRASFEAVGGFDEAWFAAEEIVLSRALHAQGRFVVLREVVRTSARKTRTYTAREQLGTMLRLAFAGRRGFKDRARLGLWYGPRRPDPR